jgi:hypothetical protein
MEQQDYLDPMEEKKLSSTLNVLTILTFIGCAWDTYQGVKNFLTNDDKALEKLAEAQEKLREAKAPEFFQKMVGPEVQEFVRKSIENSIPLLLMSIIGVLLCLFGAIQMRKKKMQGYYLWLTGELLPIISVFIFTGSIFLKTPFVWFLICPLIFIILYTFQRKNLTEK